MSGFLVDTNVVSEIFKPRPDRRVQTWLREAEPSTLFMSALTAGEIEKGIARLPSGKRRTALEVWFEKDLLVFFARRVVDVNLEIARTWGRLAVKRAAEGRPLPVVDGLISAIALHHGLTLVTRNTSDFERIGLPLFDPWQS